MSKVDGHLLRTRDLEWYETPMPVVGLVGRPDLHTAIVKSVPQVHLLRFIPIDLNNHRFPSKNPKRLNYEGYEPPGLLKNSWITKHLKKLPAVCLLLVDFEEGKNPEHLESEVGSLLVTLKDLPNFPTYMKTIVVFIRQQHNDDEAHYLERFSRWSKRIQGLDGARSFLFLSPLAMKIDLKKLESMAFDFSQAVYTHLAKSVKSHKHKVSKSSQQALYVRHHFKIGFYAETINDLTTAHKYYLSSATFLKQIMFNIRGGTTIEIKAVADLLNYKICRILISLRRINEAQEQFKQHIKYYSLLTGLNDLLFLHFSWLATQYCTFADMLDSVPPSVFVRSRQNNNGYLYETAASYTFKRRNCAQEQNVQTSSFIAERNTFGPAVYLGHPLTKLAGGGLGASGGGDETKEKPSDHMYVTSALTEEKGIDHSQLGIALLTRALEIFKREKANRMILHIAAQMAIEHYHSKQYQVAKQYFDRIVRTYRSDQWFSILFSILRFSLNCGMKLEMQRDVIVNILELLGKNPDDKIVLFRQLLSLLTEEQNKLEKEPSAATLSLTTTAATLSSPTAAPASVLLVPFVCNILACSAYFLSNPIVEVKENVEFVLTIKSQFPMSVKFSKIIVVTTNEHYNFALVSNSEDDWNKVGQFSASEVKTPEQLLTLPTPTLSLNKTVVTVTSPTNNAFVLPSSSSEIAIDTLFFPNSTRTFRINFQTFLTTSSTPLSISHLLFFLPSQSPPSSSSAVAAASLICQCPCSVASFEPILPTPPIPVPVIDENFKSYVTLRGVETQKAFGETYWQPTTTTTLSTSGEEGKSDNINNNIQRRNALDIAPAKPKAYFEVEQRAPALIDEYHCVMLTIHSNGDSMKNSHVKFECVSDTKQDETSTTTATTVTSASVAAITAAAAGATFSGSEETNSSLSNNNVNDGKVQLYAGFGLPEPDAKHIFFRFLEGENVLVPIINTLPLPNLNANSTHALPVFVCARLRRPHVLSVTTTITYDNWEGVNLTYTASFTVNVEIPFKIRARYFSDIPVPKIINEEGDRGQIISPTNTNNTKAGSSRNSVSKQQSKYPPMLLAGQECILYVEIENNSAHHPILVTSLNVNLPSTSAPTSVFSLDARLGCGDRHTIKFSFRPSQLGQLLGALCIRWTRLLENPNSFEKTSLPVMRTRAITSIRGPTNETTIHIPAETPPLARDDKPVSISSFDPLFSHPLPDNHFLEVLPVCEIRAPPLQVSVKFPPSGSIGRTFLMRVSITNRTTAAQVVAATLDTTPAMAVSGLRSTSFTLAPSDRNGLQKMELVYRLAPLQCGYIPLPKLQLKSLPSKASLLDPGDLGFVFIVPNEKSTSS